MAQSAGPPPGCVGMTDLPAADAAAICGAIIPCNRKESSPPFFLPFLFTDKERRRDAGEGGKPFEKGFSSFPRTPILLSETFYFWGVLIQFASLNDLIHPSFRNVLFFSTVSLRGKGKTRGAERGRNGGGTMGDGGGRNERDAGGEKSMEGDGSDWNLVRRKDAPITKKTERPVRRLQLTTLMPQNL